MNENNSRIEFLAQSFEIFDPFDATALKETVDRLVDEGFEVDLIKDTSNKLLAIRTIKYNKKNKKIQKIHVSSDIFVNMLTNDPTKNKKYLQWLLTIFTNLIKSGDLKASFRLVNEDLPMAKEFLEIFNSVKERKRFKEVSLKSFSLQDIADPTNINQYKNLSQLFEAVDPFVEKEPSALEALLNKMVSIGEAEIPFKDRQFTVYLPKTVAASVIFSKFAGWCTSRPENSNFASYRNDKTPDGKPSELYIIIDNGFFKELNTDIYQIHFETNQWKDKNNSANVDIGSLVIDKSVGIRNYFKKVIGDFAKINMKKGVPLYSNRYVTYLMELGIGEIIFEYLDVETPVIKFANIAGLKSGYTNKKITVRDMVKINRFNNLEQLILSNVGLETIEEEIGDLYNLEVLILNNNNITKIPEEIGNLKKLKFINLYKNNITEFPNSLTNLDKSNGGSLGRLALRKEDISEENYKKLVGLLPTTIIN